MDAASSRRQPPGWARPAIAAGLVGFAALAAGSGADRLSAGNPALAARVPALFASEALRTLGAEALSGGKAVDAAAIGEAAIRNAPTDPQSTAIFGAGKLAAGEQVTADRAFRVAGQLGWRVPITQSYWMGQALAEGKYDIAALRLDALLRQQPALLRQRQLIDPMERNPAGRTAMIARMRLNPAWLSAYTGDVYQLPADVLLQRAEVLGEAAQSGLMLGCNEITPIAYWLSALKQHFAGSVLWRQHCPAAGTGLVSDGELAMLDIGEKPTAFGWVLNGNAELLLTLSRSEGGGGKRLTVDGTTGVPLSFLSQIVVLDPGRYVLAWRSENLQNRMTSRIVASVVCLAAPPQWVFAERDRTSRLWRANFEVDGPCTAQQVNFGVASGTGQVWLEQIKMVRAP